MNSVLEVNNLNVQRYLRAGPSTELRVPNCNKLSAKLQLGRAGEHAIDGVRCIRNSRLIKIILYQEG